MYHLGMQEPREWDTTKVINGDISKSSTDFFVVLAFKIGQNFFPYAGRDLIIDCEAREIMYLVASVRLFVCLSVCVCSPVQEEPLPVQSVCLCACNQWVYADNRADAVDRLLIYYTRDKRDCLIFFCWRLPLVKMFFVPISCPSPHILFFSRTPIFHWHPQEHFIYIYL